MKNIREQLQDKNTKIAISLGLSLAFLVPLIQSLFVKDPGKQMIATVNSKGIDVMSFQRMHQELMQTKQQIEQLGSPISESLLRQFGLQGDLTQIALNYLIQEKLSEQILDSYGIKVSKEFIQDKLDDPLFIKSELKRIIPESVLRANGTIDVDKLNKYILRQGITIEQFDKHIKDIFIRDLVNQFISQSVEVPKQLTKEYYITEQVPRVYNLLSVGIGNYEDKVRKQDLSKQELLDFYNTHTEDYKIPEKRSAIIWKFSPKDFNIKINDKEIEKYYNSNKDSFDGKKLVDVKDQIKEILQQNKFLKRFNSQMVRVVNKFKDNPEELNDFIKENKATELKVNELTNDGSKQAQKIFKVKKVDGLTFYTEDGIGYVIKITKIKKSNLPEFDKVDDQVREDFIKFKAKELLNDDIKSIYNNVLYKDMKLKDQAKDFNNSKYETITVNPKDKEQNKEDLPIDTMLQMASKGEVKYLLYNNKGYVVKLDEIKDINKDDFEAKQKEYKRKAQNRLEGIIYQGFVENLRKNAIISYKINLNR